MRSIKLCLLVFITSCVLDPSDAQDFCPIGADATAKSCDDAPIDDPTTLKEMIKWNLETSFGNRKLFPENAYVEVNMDRALFVDNVQEDLDITFESRTTNYKKCRLMYMRKQGASAPTYDSMNIGSISFIKPFRAQEKSVFAVLDPECRLYAATKQFTKNNNDIARKSYIFSSNLKTSKLSDKIERVENEKKLGHFIEMKKRGIIEGNVKMEQIPHNRIFHFPNKVKVDGSRLNCRHRCMHGRIFEFNLKLSNGVVQFANKFKLTKKCEWLSIHLYDDQLDNAAEISLRHSFVKLPSELKVFPMDFTSADPLTAQHDPSVNGPRIHYEVSVAYYIDSSKESQLVIFNSHGKSVRAFSVQKPTGKITFTVSHDTCLADVIGAKKDAEKNTNDKYTMKSFEFVNSLNLGALVLKDSQNFDAHRYSLDANADKADDYKSEGAFELIPLPPPVIPNDVPDGRGVAPVTEPPMNQDETNPTQKKLDPITAGPDSVQVEIDDYNAAQAKLKEIARLKNGKWYFTWAIPAGFGAGSIGTFFICNIILFVFKRSVLTFWYKAMYKRYGSDTTMGAGTTMGKTMGGETIGGGTTAGGTTSGGTTAGTTVGGETVGSTTAAA